MKKLGLATAVLLAMTGAHAYQFEVHYLTLLELEVLSQIRCVITSDFTSSAFPKVEPV
ncbi:hypothetical protein GP665_28210, partial [Escherichia coli]